MYARNSLRVGVHLERRNIQALVQTLLAQAGHQCLLDPPDEHSLAAYLQLVLDQLRQRPSSAYDVLIVGGADVEALTDPAVLLALEHLQAYQPVPIMLLTDARSEQLRTWPTLTNVAVLPEELSLHHFFLALGRLSGTFAGILNPIFEHLLSPVAAEHYAAAMERYERLVAAERSRIAVRHTWLDQRQEWLEQRRAWLDQRQEWLEAKEQVADPQYEWLQEQRAWLEQQQSEIEDQQWKVSALRRWLTRYQQKIDGEQPPSKSSAQ